MAFEHAPDVTGKVYIHEFVDIIGHNRARYMHHMTANWCPVARAERNQLCLGVWATIGSTGRWPEVVNMWELEGWEGLAANFAHETGAGRDQDPSLAAWWSVAAELRRGGVDRIVVPTDATRSVEQLIADGVRGAVYAHELVTVPVGTSSQYLDALHRQGVGALGALGIELVGAYDVAMVNESECIIVWAIPDWDTWVAYEHAWSGSGALAAWRAVGLGLGADWRRQLLVDAPLSPLRIGRQPEARDRLPLDAVQ
jgi:hypothetical protein